MVSGCGNSDVYPCERGIVMPSHDLHACMPGMEMRDVKRELLASRFDKIAMIYVRNCETFEYASYHDQACFHKSAYFLA